MIASFLNGHDVCIFSYGQTGSGKTYTMGTDCLSQEDESKRGIIPRAVRQILQAVDTDTEPVLVSF